jgi:N-acetylgalactosamine 4-sulfate 6-O-sulfotransferase
VRHHPDAQPSKSLLTTALRSSPPRAAYYGRCGTTDLHNRLAAHPSVLRSANKGPHFWDDPHSLQWYVGLYAESAARLSDGRAPRDGLLIDASSNTLTYAGVGVRDVRTPAPAATLPHVLRWLTPSVRLLVMLREPSERYYSAYTYYHKRYRIYSRFGPTGAASFHRMALADIGAFSSCREGGASARRCARTVYREAEQLVKGLYALFLESWLDAFPPSQLLVLRLEDYESSLEGHLRAVMSFLRLPHPPRRTWRRMLDKPRANRQPSGEAMLESTRDVLRAFYAEHNEHLAELLGDERYKEWHLGPERDAPMGTAREANVYGVVG